MGYFAESVDTSFTIPAAAVQPALHALKDDFGQDYETLIEAVEDRTSFTDCEGGGDPGGDFVLGRHCEKYLSDTDEVLLILGRFAAEGNLQLAGGRPGRPGESDRKAKMGVPLGFTPGRARIERFQLMDAESREHTGRRHAGVVCRADLIECLLIAQTRVLRHQPARLLGNAIGNHETSVCFLASW